MRIIKALKPNDCDHFRTDKGHISMFEPHNYCVLLFSAFLPCGTKSEVTGLRGISGENQAHSVNKLFPSRRGLNQVKFILLHTRGRSSKPWRNTNVDLVGLHFPGFWAISQVSARFPRNAQRTRISDPRLPGGRMWLRLTPRRVMASGFLGEPLLLSCTSLLGNGHWKVSDTVPLS